MKFNYALLLVCLPLFDLAVSTNAQPNRIDAIARRIQAARGHVTGLLGGDFNARINRVEVPGHTDDEQAIKNSSHQTGPYSRRRIDMVKEAIARIENRLTADTISDKQHDNDRRRLALLKASLELLTREQ